MFKKSTKKRQKKRARRFGYALTALLPILALGVRPKNSVEFYGGFGFSKDEFQSICGDPYRDARAVGLLTFVYERELPWTWMRIHMEGGGSVSRVKSWKKEDDTWEKEADGVVWWMFGAIRLDMNFRYAGVGIGVEYHRPFFPDGAQNEKDEANSMVEFLPQAWVRLGPRLFNFYIGWNMFPLLAKTIIYSPIGSFFYDVSFGAGTENRLMRLRATFSTYGYFAFDGSARVSPRWLVGTRVLVPIKKMHRDNNGIVGVLNMSREF